MEIFNFLILVALVYLTLILGRMWMKDDIFRRFKSIEEEGETLRRPEDVCQLINSLRDKVRLGNNKIEMLESCYDTATSKLTSLEGDYKNLMEQMKSKREEVEDLKNEMEILRKVNNHLEDNLSKARKAVDELMAKAYNLAEEMNNECGEVINTGAKYAKAMDKSAVRSIYAYILHNKTTLLTVGICGIEKNGKVSYPVGSRSLGNAQSTENAECFAELTASLNLNAGEYKRIGVIANYEKLQACAKTFSGIEHGVTKIIGISTELMNYLALNKGMLNKIK